jgi:acetolactate synthase I/II/III large subunit
VLGSFPTEVIAGGGVALSDRLKKIHQTMDSVGLCRPVTKYSAEVDSPEAVSEVLINALRCAESDRPGAAFVSLPMDIMVGPAKCDVLTPPSYSGAGPADTAAITEAARLINRAKRPVVLLGLLKRFARADSGFYCWEAVPCPSSFSFPRIRFTSLRRATRR